VSPGAVESVPSRREGWLGWAVYLGVSWTWVIGMFLPVLLVRDHGVWGFVAFAVPNVLGAAAMGWVIRSRDVSLKLMREHRGMLIGFALVTIALQAYVLGWFAWWALSPGYMLLVLAAVAGLGLWGVLGSGRRAGEQRGEAVAALVISAVLAAIFFYNGGFTWGGSIGPPVRETVIDQAFTEVGPLGQPDVAGLLWLTPAMIVGFALCPYLDPTFHRARASLSPGGARLAFGVGFGVVFFAMILFTLAYSGTMLQLMIFKERVNPDVLLVVSQSLVLTHITVQAVFTGGLHAVEGPGRLAVGLDESQTGGRAGGRWWLLPAMLAGVCLAVGFAVGRLSGPAWPSAWGLSFAEVGYRVLLGFYAVVFPAYVWLCMVPRGGPADAAVRRRRVTLWAGVVGIAAPLVFAAFVIRGQYMPLATVAAALIVLARLLVPKGERLAEA